MPNQKISNQLLIFVNFYQLARNKAVSSICSREIVHLKILLSDWLRIFWPVSQEQDLSQIKDLCISTANNKNFYCKTSSVKIKDKAFLEIQKIGFLAYF